MLVFEARHRQFITIVLAHLQQDIFSMSAYALALKKAKAETE